MVHVERYESRESICQNASYNTCYAYVDNTITLFINSDK